MTGLPCIRTSTASLRRVVLSLLAVVSAAAPVLKSRGEEPPNVVVVLFDDMSYGQPRSCRQDSEFQTPWLDRLANEGLRFTDAHAAASLCTPTRYGLLTGRYPSRIGQFACLSSFSDPIIPPQRLTIASLLRRHGYRTACIGKWHLGMKWADDQDRTEQDRKPVGVSIGTRVHAGPIALGFDEFWGYTHSANMGMIFENDRVVASLSDVEVQPLLARKATEFIDASAAADAPFLLYLPLSPPHGPHVTAPEFVGKSGVTQDWQGGNYGDWLYQGDWVLGQVVEALHRNGVAANTLVLVASDNGAPKRIYPPLRGSKASIYEGGHRVPLIAWWPGRIRPGSVCGQTVCLNDVLATCADLLATRLPDDAGEDSVSLLPLFRDPDSGPVREATIHQSVKGILAIRSGDWKLIFLEDGKRELYDLQSDIGETRDVVAQHPAVAERLETLIRKHLEQGRSTPGKPQPNGVALNLDRIGTTSFSPPPPQE